MNTNKLLLLLLLLPLWRLFLIKLSLSLSARFVTAKLQRSLRNLEI